MAELSSIEDASAAGHLALRVLEEYFIRGIESGSVDVNDVLSAVVAARNSLETEQPELSGRIRERANAFLKRADEADPAPR